MSIAWKSIIVFTLAFIGLAVVAVLCAGWLDLRGKLARLWAKKERCSEPRLPDPLQRALVQLESLTDMRPSRNLLTEPEDAECPICLSRLYPSDTRSSISAADHDTDLETGNGISRAATIITVGSGAVAEKHQPAQPIHDEVLKMKKCRHVFHAKCLATWFLRKEYRCPVCRVPYYEGEEETREEDYRIQTLLPVAVVW
ncbi:hypothetical protein F5Y11DRAFT_17757 [Daldinia sp. FL1419]|nr:hypothetical protein F5Y11DRAFT_17757 [Daldinia sp. FL1419]